MESATIEEVKAEQAIFTDLWNVFKKFYHATTDDEWQQFVNETDKMYKEKYKGKEHEQLFRDILSDIIKHLERRFRSEGNKTN